MLHTKNKHRIHTLLILAFVTLFVTASASAQVMYIRGTISGNVNGKDVEFGLDIKLDMDTGEETAAVTNMDPEMGAIMRQVTAMVTIGGPTGGATPQGGSNLFELSEGNYENSATMYWRDTRDTLELIHTVSYIRGDTMNVEATINGTVPVISAEDEVEFSDFSETLYWRDQPAASDFSPQVVTTGVGFRGDFEAGHGFRQYLVGGKPFPGGAGKGSKTTYVGPGSPGPVSRFASKITSTYDAEKRTMNVHLFNTLTPLESKPSTPYDE